MSKPLLPLVLLAFFLTACGGKPDELAGRPLVLQLGAKISLSASTSDLDAVAARVTTAKLGPKVIEHLNAAIAAQSQLLQGAAEMQLNERMTGAQKVVAEIQAASDAVE
jgi:ABC-type transporter Mla subunit MlaD